MEMRYENEINNADLWCQRFNFGFCFLGIAAIRSPTSGPDRPDNGPGLI